MQILPSADLINDAFQGGYAVPSFCVWDSSTTESVLRVAADCRAPVMLMCGWGEFDLTGPGRWADTARALAGYYDVRIALHLDHGRSPKTVENCLAAGFTSVMLDFSTKPYDENVAALRAVVERVRPLGVTVEGELGAVGRVDATTVEGSVGSELTDPDMARTYVQETGVDMLAVSIGNAHGLYAARPEFDFDLLAALRDAAGVPLVLHGGSGTPQDHLERAISLGMAKINVASELNAAVRESLMSDWSAGERQWVPSGMAHAMEAHGALVEKWFRITGAAGKG